MHEDVSIRQLLCKFFKNPFPCSDNCDDIRICVYVENVYGFTTFLRNVNSARICLRLYRSYVRPRLKFNAIKPREMSAVEGISVAPFQTPTLHSYGVYSAETFTVLQLSLRCDVRRQCNGLRVRDIHGGA